MGAQRLSGVGSSQKEQISEAVGVLRVLYG